VILGRSNSSGCLERISIISATQFSLSKITVGASRPIYIDNKSIRARRSCTLLRSVKKKVEAERAKVIQRRGSYIEATKDKTVQSKMDGRKTDSKRLPAPF